MLLELYIDLKIIMATLLSRKQILIDGDAYFKQGRMDRYKVEAVAAKNLEQKVNPESYTKTLAS